MLSAKNDMVPYYLISPISKLHSKVESLLTEPEDEGLKQALLLMLVDEPLERIDAANLFHIVCDQNIQY